LAGGPVLQVVFLPLQVQHLDLIRYNSNAPKDKKLQRTFKVGTLPLHLNLNLTGEITAKVDY
jgi:hypothetical protein